MINFDSLTLKALIKEIEPILTSGRIQKVQQPSRHEILLGIRAMGKNHKLYICVDPKYPHVCLLTDEGEEYRDITIPQKPPMFCMLLRKHMEGTKIRAVKQPEYERILEIYFESYNEIGGRVPLVLACELMGKHSNVILYNYDTNVIIGSAHNVGPEKSREREISGGLPYIYPPKPAKRDLLKISEYEFLAIASSVSTTLNHWLNENFNDISLALANELCKVCGIDTSAGHIIATPKDKIIKLYNLALETLSFKNLNPSMDKKLFSLIGLSPDVEWSRVDTVNTMVDLYFGYHEFSDKFSRLKSNLASTVNKELKKQKAKQSQYQKNLESEDKAEKYKKYADLIMANLHKIKPGADKADLEDYFDENKIISIQLDPALSASINAQKYYKLYTKTRNAIKISEELVNNINEEIDYLDSVKIAIDQAENISDLKQIREELSSQDIIKSKEKPAKTERTGITEHTIEGYHIYVGKNNKQNDYIVSKLASSNDIWLHAQNIPGAHILIKLPQENIEVPESVLHQAANLAAYYSKGRNSSNVQVIYTRRKFLKKPSGSKPGYVTYSHEKTLFVNPDEIQVRKLTETD